MIVESILWIPILLLFIVGMVQLGKIAYIYHTLHKVLNAGATFLAHVENVSFCTDTNDAITNAKNFALTGTTDGSTDSFLPALTADQIQVTAECFDPTTGVLGACNISGCDLDGNGGQRPDFIDFAIPDGYQISPRLPHIITDPILLRPQVRVAFGGS